MCRRYSQRPSEMVGITQPALALDFDLAMATVHRMEDQSHAAEAAAHNNPLAGLLLMLT